MREDPAPPSAKDPSPSREDRLAAKLRENLKRRKAQARELAGDPTPTLPKGGVDG